MILKPEKNQNIKSINSSIGVYLRLMCFYPNICQINYQINQNGI